MCLESANDYLSYCVFVVLRSAACYIMPLRPDLCGWGNYEQQTYTLDNHQVKDGVLIISVSLCVVSLCLFVSCMFSAAGATPDYRGYCGTKIQ